MSSYRSTASKRIDEYRLPTNVKPIHYDVTVRTDLETLTFKGFVKIDLDVLQDTSVIVFNTSELDLGDAILYSEALKTELAHSSLSIDTEKERAIVTFPHTVPAGSKAQLKISFKGTLTSSMQGYYKSAWEWEGKTQYYALTQFESTAGRRGFPCWDEPLLKATFGITMVSRTNTVNLSNMSIISEEDFKPSREDTNTTLSSLTKWFSALTTQDDDAKEKWKITRFETTPPMSTYIVAYANGPFEFLETSYTSPLSGKTRPLRIYTTPDGINQAQWALDVKAKVLPLYEQVFEIEYPLPKLDTLVAHDFDAGAMENWGLITGRTNAFLMDPKRPDLKAKQRIVSMQAHEVAHMWFGNITTMEWWDNLYLNEGFATYVGEVIIADKVFPDWKLDSSFISDYVNSAMKIDAKLSSHPIEVEVADAALIDQIFDSLSYNKAASVLRMLAKYVGEERFLKGVSIYLKKHLYKNSVTIDLWEGIGEATDDIDVPALMDNWVKKMGFPFLTVTETADGIHIRQDRFLESGPADPKDNETIWTVPLSLLTVNGDGAPSIDHSAVLSSRETNIAIDTSKPFKLNGSTSGLYRVLYSPSRLEKIAEEAAKGDAIFSLNDRIGLVHDTFALAKAGLSKVSSGLTFVDILKNEKEYLVCESISEALSTLIATWWEDPLVVGPLNAFRRTLFNPLVKHLGYEYPADDPPDTILLRTLAIECAALAEDPHVLKELESRFSHYMKTGDNSKIPADLQKITFKMAVRYGTDEEYNFIKEICAKPPNPSASTAAQLALGASQDKKLIDETLDYSLNKARDQDVIYFFNGLASNTKARRILIAFFEKHFNTFYEQFKGNSTMRYLVASVYSGLSTQKDSKAMALFFEGKDQSKYDQALAQTLDTIKAKAVWVERSSEDIKDWLGKKE